MIVTIPLAKNEKPEAGVLEALNFQTIFCDVQYVYGDNTKEDLNMQAHDNICQARNLCLDILLRYDYGLMLDGDCIIDKNYPDTLKLMFGKLQNTQNLVAVAVWEQDPVLPEGYIPPMIEGGCMMFKQDFFTLGLKFWHDRRDNEWGHLTEDVRAMGKKIAYLDNRQRIKNLHN
jgi:hypothetical protein